jgi:hypothetical protein
VLLRDHGQPVERRFVRRGWESAAGLTGLEHKGAHAPGAAALVFETPVQFPLHPVERKGTDIPRLAADEQPPPREVDQIDVRCARTAQPYWTAPYG